MIKPLRFHLHQKCIHMTTCRWSLVENYVKIFIDLLHVILGLGSPSDWLRGCSIGNKKLKIVCGCGLHQSSQCEWVLLLTNQIWQE
ncbi:uncharacterized protein LOC111277222 isoform X2 [Durio zibethinus]|uniref:Uncharacterized protein LOC111277222 isoform X2 n=1 Tax=Durio zibethinus TaxID=66656 RepID=A0A6P5WTV4_DURZI|nr:uncharacterized protein LOC111277222 isoform X2 [Durio zibethinus]